MKKAIIFDMDGTLWDSAEEVTKSWNIVFKKHNLKEITNEDMQNCMGLIMDDIFIKLLPDLDPTTRKQIQDECEEYENIYLSTHCGKLYEGLEESLKQLKEMGYHNLIVTNAQDGYVQAFLKASNLDYLFTDYEMYGRTLLSKCDNIKLIIQRNNVDKAVYVGDTVWDYKSATNAGVDFIHAAYGFQQFECEHKIQKLNDLIDLVPNIL